MAARPRRRGKKPEVPSQNKIVRAVFNAAESLGISDRQMVEQFAEQVVDRLERSQPLPGMEHLVGEETGPTISESQIQAPAREIVVHKKQNGAQEQAGAVELTPNAQTVLERRYLQKDSEGHVIETPDDLFRRVAHHVAASDLLYDPNADIESREQQFYELMKELLFLPNSPTLMNAGRELGQLSACFVLPVEDSMESIFNAVKYTALIHKSGGGTGFSFSRLRPERDRVGSTGGVASGPVSFMRAFDTATDVIKQGGMRRGANMAILNVDHPDILKFIEAKENSTALTNFNLSVAVTEDFMEAVEADADYELINPSTKEAMGKLNAREVFEKMVDMAWRTGDPGVVLLDRINGDNPTPNLGAIESTNPCGEQPLLPFESCNLGSVNLSLMVSRNNGAAEIDWDKLEKTVKAAVHFLDNVIDANKFPLPQIEERTKATRKIGLGVMGFADMLIKLRVRYDSKQALEIAESIMKFIEEKSTAASVALAEQRGVFPVFEGSIYDQAGAPRVRNATRTTIAPTGTLSLIAGCSSGIEPLFALSYFRNILDGQLIEINPLFEQVAREEGFYSDELIQDVAKRGTIREREDVPEEMKGIFATAHDISPEWHVRMQAAFQRHTDNAVSKTINFPHDATRGDVARAYRLCYKEGCKGITIYRDRSRDTQVLSMGTEGEKAGKAKMTPRKRPSATTGFTRRVTTGCGNLYVTVNFDDNGICELFTSLGKSGGCASAQLEAISRLCSLALRSGIDVQSIIKHLKGIRCPSIAWDSGHAVLSCADAIGGVLEETVNGERPKKGKADKESKEGAEPLDMGGNLVGQCPECGGLLVYQEGCFICPACGYTKC